jgi:hypothetical protein
MQTTKSSGVVKIDQTAAEPPSRLPHAWAYKVQFENGSPPMTFNSPMTFASVDDEVFYCLQGLDHRSDLLNLLPMAAYVVRADGVVIWYNARAAELWGREPAVGDTDERFCGAHTLYHPDGSHMAHCDTPVALALRTGISVHEEEVIVGRLTEAVSMSPSISIRSEAQKAESLGS